MMRTTPLSLLLAPLLLAGCVAVPTPGDPQRPSLPGGRPAPPAVVPPGVPPPPVVSGFRAPEIMRAPGLEGVMQQPADRLLRQFGTPRLDVAEGDMRKLQFAGQPCVLDIFLYPLRAGAEPVATHVEARRASDGQDVDRAACVAALARR